MGGVTIAVPPMHLDQQQQPNLLQMAAQVYGLKNQQQEGQALALQIQQQQQALKDQNAATAAIKAWDGKDPEALRKGIIDNGGSANAAFAAQQHLLGIKEQASKIAADDATTGAKNIETLKGKSDAIAGAVNGLKSLPDEQLIPAAQQKIQELQQSGMLSPQEAQQAGSAIGQMQDPKKVRDSLDGIAKMHTFQSQQMDAALKDSEAKKNTAQAGEAGAQTNKINAEINPANPADPNIARQKYQGILQKIQQGGVSAVTPDELAWAKSHEASERKTTTQSDTLGVVSNSTSGPAGLASVGAGRGQARGAGSDASSGTPANTTQDLKNSYVDMIGQYKLNPTMLQRMIVKHPDVLAQVQQKYPDFDQTDYNAKNKLLSDYTSGKGASQINAVNTAMGHIGTLADAVDALKNGNIPIINKIANAIGVQIGNTPQTTVQTIVHRVGPELAAAYIAGGGSAGERGTTEADFDLSKGNDQLKQNLSITAELLRSKIGALENQYKNTVKRDDFQQRFITPAAQKALNTLSPQAVIQIGDKKYQYKGSGNTADLSNYTELK